MFDKVSAIYQTFINHFKIFAVRRILEKKQTATVIVLNSDLATNNGDGRKQNYLLYFCIWAKTYSTLLNF